MISRSIALGLLAAGCVAAAGGGAYVTVRQNAVEPAPAAVAVQPPPSQQPVSETEALVMPATSATTPVERSAVAPAPAAAERSDAAKNASRREGARNGRTMRRNERPATTSTQRSTQIATAPAAAPVEQPESARESASPAPAAPVEATPEPPRYVEPSSPEPKLDEVTVPASAVIGLQIETTVSSERAQVEDRVSARVTRDVMAAGRVAIPAGSRVLGSVTLVERGGKIKERARLGVRFHTLVLADGSELPVRTEPIFREGESPARDSSRKIGGAAVGGAILGAILGGGKGAVTGGAIGAAGGTAAAMAGERHAATLPNGAIVTVRLSAPVDIEIEKH